MNPLEERFNDRLEHSARNNGQPPSGFLLPGPTNAHQPNFDELLALAHQLQQDPQVRVAPDFARQLERRVLRRHTELRLRQGQRSFSLLTFLHTRRVLSSVLGTCLLICLLSTSMLALAAQASGPNNPLYGLKRWEQHVQLQFSSPADQATLHLQLARDDLKALPSLTDADHKQAYSMTLLDLDQQADAADTAISNVPAGTTHDGLVTDLASLKTDARQTLRLLLPDLIFQERVITTDELARLEDTVPQLTSATVTLPAHIHEIATISLTGQNIAENAQLLIDGRVIAGTGTLRHGLLTFEVDWDGNQHPQNVGILNPDGTAAQTTTLTIKQTNNPNGNGNGNNNGNTNGNGNGNKPTSTSTPNNNKPTSTPTPHR